MKPLGGTETILTRPVAILGHQGGWDEILLVVGPLAVVGVLLWLANKRVSAQLSEELGESEESGGSDSLNRDQAEK